MEEPTRGPKDFLRIVVTGTLALVIGVVGLVLAVMFFGWMPFSLKLVMIGGLLAWAFWDAAEWVLGKRSE